MQVSVQIKEASATERMSRQAAHAAQMRKTSVLYIQYAHVVYICIHVLYLFFMVHVFAQFAVTGRKRVDSISISSAKQRDEVLTCTCAVFWHVLFICLRVLYMLMY